MQPYNNHYQHDIHPGRNNRRKALGFCSSHYPNRTPILWKWSELVVKLCKEKKEKGSELIFSSLCNNTYYFDTNLQIDFQWITLKT